MGSQPLKISESLYLVERYWPGVTVEQLRSAVERLDALDGEGGTRHLGSMLIPAEECVFSLFCSASRDAVAALNTEAGVPYDRVVAAVVAESSTGTR